MVRKNIRNFYISPNDEITYVKFKEICKREGDSISKKILDLMRKYVEEHYDEHNPQREITDYDKDLKPKPKLKFRKGKVWCYRDERWVWRVTCLDLCDDRGTCEVAREVRRSMGLLKGWEK